MREATSPHTVPNSLPVLYFGSPNEARCATVGLNPSKQEFLDLKGSELDGTKRRFHTLGSLGASSRSALTDEQCDLAVQLMDEYFQVGRRVYKWFIPLDRVLSGLGLSYRDKNATHLDLVQEATNPTWSALIKEFRNEAETLLKRDIKFLVPVPVEKYRGLPVEKYRTVPVELCTTCGVLECLEGTNL